MSVPSRSLLPSPLFQTGGPIYRNGSAGGNNWPLRGGKKSNFEGGVRVNAFVTGGLVPAARRGAVEHGFAASEDWFRTFAGLAGVDPTDEKAAAAGLPPVEGYDLWPLLSGANATSPRTELWLGSGGAGDVDNSQHPILQGLVRADGYKVLWGNVIENTWTGPFYPNKTTAWCDTCPLDCGTIDAPTCLFNVLHVLYTKLNHPPPTAPSDPNPTRGDNCDLHALTLTPQQGRPDRAREPRGRKAGHRCEHECAAAGAHEGYLRARPRPARRHGRVLRGRQGL